MRHFILCILVCFALACFSQKTNQQNAPFTIRGNVGIPQAITSKAYRTSFAGLYEANLSFNLRVFSNFYAGLGYQNSYFQNNKFLKMQLFNASIPYNTRLMGNGIFLKLGYDQFFSDPKKGYFSYALNSGYMLCNYSNVNGDTSLANRPYVNTKFNAPYTQAEVSFNFIVEDNLSFSLMLSYTSLFYHFDPRAPRFAQFEEIGKASNHAVMSWMNVAAGFNILIGKKK